MPDSEQLTRFQTGQGFLVALDQSGGSTPTAHALSGVDDAPHTGEEETFDLIHAARTRVITSRAFTNERILGAILVEGSFDREVDGRGVAEYLWAVKGILPFLKIDTGLNRDRDGVQTMREIPCLDALLARAAARGIFGTKARSVIHAANAAGIDLVVTQQVRVAEHALAAGLVPILQLEVDIHSPDKAEAEKVLMATLLRELDVLAGSEKIAIAVTIPSVDGFYVDLIAHPRVARVMALSNGFDRDGANVRLARNPGMIASVDRALIEGLTAHQPGEEFDRTLDASIESIYRASIV